MLLDNFSAHKTDKVLTNVELLMLPPNTTSHLQPQYAGIIQAFKSKIQALRNERAVVMIDTMLEQQGVMDEKKLKIQAAAVFNVDVKHAMRWAQLAWEHITQSTIANCWRHTEILDDDMRELGEKLNGMSI